ncbi:MAG TPA: hypothetical protein PK390_04365 [Fervidobacterium nodosum]|nr:hypothetical protein [Fervidobacterium nodosum]
MHRKSKKNKGYIKYRSGIISISIAFLIFLLASLSAVVLSGIMREVIEVESRVQNSLDSSKSKLMITSAANIWTKFLTDNGGQWDNIQYPIEENITNNSIVTSILMNDYIKVNLGNSERTINYTLNSTTTSYSKYERVITVKMDIIKNNQKTQFGGSVDFGWPGY